MVCLDTDVIINLFRNEPKTILSIRELEKFSSFSTTAVNSFELWKGFFKTRKLKADKKLSGFLESVSLLNLDGAAGKKAAEIFENLRNSNNYVK